MFKSCKILEEINYWGLTVIESAIVFAVVVVLTALIYYISGFHFGNIKESMGIRRSLSSVKSKNAYQLNSAKQVANQLVKRSYVRHFKDGKIRIRVPTKFFLNCSSIGDVRDIIRDRLKGETFREFLETEFPNNSFGQPINHKGFYEINSD